jgi:hypothetical protein
VGSRREHDDPHDHRQGLDPKEGVAIVCAKIEGRDRTTASQCEGALQPSGASQVEVATPSVDPPGPGELSELFPLLSQGSGVDGVVGRQRPGRIDGAQATVPSV